MEVLFEELQSKRLKDLSDLQDVEARQGQQLQLHASLLPPDAKRFKVQIARLRADFCEAKGSKQEKQELQELKQSVSRLQERREKRDSERLVLRLSLEDSFSLKGAMIGLLRAKCSLEEAMARQRDRLLDPMEWRKGCDLQRPEVKT